MTNYVLCMYLATAFVVGEARNNTEGRKHILCCCLVIENFMQRLLGHQKFIVKGGLAKDDSFNFLLTVSLT